MIIILSLLMLFTVFCLEAQDCSGSVSVITSQECHALNVISNEGRCCFLYVEEKKGVKERRCVPITKEQFEGFKEYFEYLKQEYPDANELRFDCNSQILSISLLAMLAVLY